MGTRRTRSSRSSGTASPVGGATADTAVAALGLAAAATTSHVLDVAPLWGAAAGVAGAATSVAVGAHQQTTPSGQMLRIGRWAASGTWLTWCLATTPWDLNTLLALAVGAGISSGLTPLLAPRAPRASATGRGGGLVLRATSQLEREWETRLARITRRSGYQVTHTEHWDTGAGYTLTVELPSGMTRRALVPYLDALAADARLMEGCGVEAAPARYRGTVRLLVSTVNRMAHTIDYPADFAPRSILDPITLGEHRDSSPAQARWREHSALVAGQKGSGKTTLLECGHRRSGPLHRRVVLAHRPDRRRSEPGVAGSVAARGDRTSRPGLGGVHARGRRRPGRRRSQHQHRPQSLGV
ncbi:hypothetical protein ABH917_000052 [Thermobifida halotolerans]